jgi:pimeloyl-ACP methyl ester carboxylesterase
MPRSAAVDGFRLAYDRAGSGPAVVLLHGWPGDRTDFRRVVPLLTAGADIVAPDLRGFGESDKHDQPPAHAYSAAAQARSVAGLIAELGLRRPVLAGYDVGSRIVQAVAIDFPERTRAIVIAPPLPGAGNRVFTPQAQQEFWYQAFHQLDLATELIDGRPAAVRAYLRHFWTHWSGPAFTPAEPDLDRLVSRYASPGAFTASIGWYRAGAGTVARSAGERAPAPGDRIATPATVLWPEHDPLFPPAWSDRMAEFFAAAELRRVGGAGHFVPLEAPEAFAAALLERCRTGSEQP